MTCTFKVGIVHPTLELYKYFSRQLGSVHIGAGVGCLFLSEYGVSYRNEFIHQLLGLIPFDYNN